MASITFRLRSSNYVGAINMDGKVITVREVQSAVAEKLKAPEEEIRVFMPDSDDLLHPDEDLLAYSVIDVVRQSHTGRLTYASSKASRNAAELAAAAAAAASSGSSGLAGGQDAMTEEERLAQLQAEVSFDTGIDQVQNSRFRRGGGPGGRGGGFYSGGRGGGGGDGGGPDGGGPGDSGGGGRGRGGGPGGGGGFNPFDPEHFRPPPRSYICHNCGKSGHYIQHCPAVKANGGKHARLLAPPTGIPESMLVECTMDDPAPKFITRDQRLVKRRMDSSAFATVVLPTITTPTAAEDKRGGDGDGSGSGEGNCTNAGGVMKNPNVGAAEGQPAVSEALQCMVDHVPAVSALRSPCCGRLICQSCLNALLEKAMKALDSVDPEPLGCPACAEPLMLDSFEPATKEREEIVALLNSRKRLRS